MNSTISSRAAISLFKYEEFSSCNTQVTVFRDGDYQVAELRLHGTVIATLDPYEGLMICLGGYNSRVTRSRLNALPSVEVINIGGKPTLYSPAGVIAEWDGEWFNIPYLEIDVNNLLMGEA